MRWLWSWSLLSVACLSAGDAPSDDGESYKDTSSDAEETQAGPHADVEDGTLWDSAPDEAVTSDSTTSDFVEPDVAIDSPLPVACTQGSLGAHGVVVFDQRTINMTPVLFDGVSLVGLRARASDLMDYRSDIVRFDLLSGNETRLSDDDHVLLPVDADAGAVVYVARDEDKAITRLKHIGDDGKTLTLFEGSQGSPVGGRSLWPRPIGWQGPLSYLESGVVVWRETASNEARPWESTVRVLAMREGTSAVVWEGVGTSGDLVMRNWRALWMHQDTTPYRLWLADLNFEVGRSPREPIRANDVLDFTLTDDALWWVTRPYEGGRVMRMDLDSDEIREVHPGPCRHLVAGATRVVSLCGDGPLVARGFGLVENGRPTVLDGARTAVLPVDEDRFDEIQVVVFATEGERVVWGEYPRFIIDPGVSCAPAAGSAVLKMAEVVSDGSVEAIHTIAELAVGCWCCENHGYWAVPDVRLSPSGLAWNYPITAPRDTHLDQVEPIGWLLFDELCTP